MGISLELKRNSRLPKNTKPLPERVILLPPSNQVSKHQDRSVVQNHCDPHREFAKEGAKSSSGIQYRQSSKSHDVEDSELVKHMTNLPGYLKRTEKAEVFQDKVLNVGVLDWSRLVQWKRTQKNGPENGSSSTSCSTSSSALKKSSGSSRSSSLAAPTSRLYEQRSLLRSQDIATPSKNHVSEKEKIKGIDQYKGYGDCSSSRHGVTKKPIEVSPETDIKTRNADQKICSEVEASSVEKKIARSVRTRSRVKDSKQSDTELADRSFPEEGNRIVLLQPKEPLEKESSELPKLSRPRRLSFDKTLTVPRKFSFSDDISTTNDISKTPHACPLPYSVDTNVNTNKQDHHLEPPVVRLSGEHTEPTGVGSRNPSPLRRFSLGLGRMGRSLSFKEGIAIPQLKPTHVSIKSGPVSFDASNCVDNPNEQKVKAHHNRPHSSPFRRLLDPILKHKEPYPQTHHQSEHHLPPKVSVNSFSSGPVCSSPNVKPLQESRVQALLQLKVNNGIPLFKFVANNDNILAATMKSLGSSGKDDSGRYYTFYLVNEVKKKSGGLWMTQGSKAKNCGYAYNVVGQMKVSVSDLSDTRESVLFGIERNQADRGSPKFKPNKELAAAIIRKDEESIDEQRFPESRYSNRVTVILPGGIHSTPDKGDPSPLISRWRSGGLCDCGGWDVGCQLRVLSDRSKCDKGSKGFKDGRILDSFQLLVQGAEQDGPIFNLVPSRDGIYSVEYNSSISRLQAFFICVSMLSSQKLPHVPSKPFDPSDFVSEHEFGPKFPAKYAPIPPLSPAGRV